MEVVVTAMTKMQNGVCFAGINPSTNKWVRPVWNFGQWRHINYYRQPRLVGLGDLIRLSNPRPRPNPPHIEDVYVSGFSFVRETDPKEFESILQRSMDCKAVDDVVLRTGNSSLCLFQPTEFDTVYVSSKDALNSRISFRIGDKYYKNDTYAPGFPCTDLRWRAYRREHVRVPRVSDFDTVYLALGLTRTFQATGKTHPMIISIITFPSFEFRLDPGRL